MTNNRFRLKRKSNGRRYLQVQGKLNIFGISFKVWGYIPDSLIVPVKKPITLPFATSHCYIYFYTIHEADKFMKTFDLDKHMKQLRIDKEEFYTK